MEPRAAVTSDLEDMSLEDVVPQLDGLLTVQLVLQPREPEGQQCVATPAGGDNQKESDDTR